MENQIMLPAEVSELAVKVSEKKQQEVNTVLNQIFTGTAQWESQVDAIVDKDINDKMSIQLADTARLNVKKARLYAEKIFDTKREEVQQIKAEYDLEDKLWLKAKQVMQLKFKAIEEKVEWKARIVECYEAEQKELRTQLRLEKIQKYNPEINRYEIENLSNELFEVMYAGLEKAYNDRIEEEKKAEAERIAREDIEKAKKKAEAAPDKQKLIQLANDLEIYRLPEMKSNEAKAVIESVKVLIVKTADYITQKVSEI